MLQGRFSVAEAQALAWVTLANRSASRWRACVRENLTELIISLFFMYVNYKVRDEIESSTCTRDLIPVSVHETL